MAVTYQYWRLYFNAPTNGTSVCSIAEFSFTNASGPVSLAGGTSSASSLYGGSGYPTAQAFDGNINTFWASNGTPSSGAPEWLQYQFTGAVAVTLVSVACRNDGYASSQSPTGFLIQGSPDGTTWTTLVTVTSDTWYTGQVQSFWVSTTVGNARGSQLPIEVVGGGNPHVRGSQLPVEVIGGSAPHVRGSQLPLEVMGGSAPHVHASQVCVELMYPYVTPPSTQIYQFLLP